MFYKVIRAIFVPIVHLLFNVEFEGRENLRESGAALICSNHRSFVDPVFIAVGIKKRSLCFMAKKELFSFKPFGFILSKLGAFPVNRGAGDMQAIKNAENSLNDGKLLLIFPEGTRSRDGNPIRPKSGAVYIASDTGADIIPVAICYDGKLRLRKKVTVCFGEPILNSEIKMKEENKVIESRRASALVMDRIIEMLNARLKTPVKRPFMPSTKQKDEKNEK
ncbi:MAG: lysophospholipid acyltransferase family protein [Oscillospiraceae bacterium]|nr:lysophospholipid acyltransferase family protein [Oscillospiraceae bacterium]